MLITASLSKIAGESEAETEIVVEIYDSDREQLVYISFRSEEE